MSKGTKMAVLLLQASSQRLSFGMTPKTIRLPKPGEMLLSVHGSPLGVYKEDNMEAIHGMLSPKQIHLFLVLDMTTVHRENAVHNFHDVFDNQTTDNLR